MFTKLGILKGKTREIEITKEFETRKAIQLKITERIPNIVYNEIREYIETVWLPKSLIKIVDGEYIIAPKWLLQKNNLPIFDIEYNDDADCKDDDAEKRVMALIEGKAHIKIV